MATLNPFDLLDDDAEDPSQLAVSIAADRSKKSAPVPGLTAKSAPPSKQPPPSQAVREARSDAPRGGGGFGRGRGGNNREGRGGNNRYSGGYSKPSEEGDVSKSSYERRGGGGGYGGPPRGGRRGEAGEGERPRRVFERRSGTGRGGDFKREGAGRGNWGTPGEEVLAVEAEEVAGVETEKDAAEKSAADDASKENTAETEEQKEPEVKEMTLDEYEKILEEKRKALQSQNTSERKVDTKVFESMQQLSNKKKSNDEIFIKLGSDKDKRKDDKEEKAKKAVSINEFLKPAEGENYYRGGRGGGRGRGGRDRGGRVSSGGYGGSRSEAAPAIADTAQFPSLGGK
ncbi:hypothetical protein Bca4012_023801 [Brassica carinata]|uniref:Hyaluronan/mRNA-binding protein domain-containing protein n=1 Tax=Brassica carinata TaxID=52824 RepID=A0A8X7NU58_BRACI|nr:hypothetical protein Bca52824_089890 [Brassica carinata]